MTTTHDSASDATLRRIQKLLAIAGDSRGDPAETAAAAAAMAERMMRKFNLASAELQRAALRKDPGAEMTTMRVRANMKRDDANRTPLKRAPKWAGYLAYEVAHLHDVHVRYAYDHAMGGAVVEFCGVRADVQVAAWMFDYLVGQMIRAVRHFGTEHRRTQGAAPLKTTSDAYRTDFITALLASLTRLRREKEGEVAAHAAGTALVVVKQQLVAEHFGGFEYRKASTTTKPIRDLSAFVAGRADADQHLAVLRLGRRDVGVVRVAALIVEPSAARRCCPRSAGYGLVGGCFFVAAAGCE